jgi:hypothetical protein
MGEPDVNFTKYKRSPRWSVTYAIDLIREVPDKIEHPRLGPIEVKLSRSEASRILTLIADIMGIHIGRLYVALAKEYCRRYDP